MLTALHIRNFILIEEAALELDRGLTALTGETGAGKSILLDALGFALGGRVDRAFLRDGLEEGAVAAAFAPSADHPVWTRLADGGIAGDGDEVILRRILGADGRSRAFINDQPASVALLKSVGELLVEIHGQHDGRGFLTASTHRELLDEFGDLGGLRAQVRLAFGAWRSAEEALQSRQAGRERALADADYLRHVVDELAELGAQQGEEERLASRRSELQASEKVRADLAAAVELLGEEGLEGRLAGALRRLGRAAASFPPGVDPLGLARDRLSAALDEATEARAAVAAAAERLAFDADELEAAETRLFALRAAARKHGVQPDALPGVLAKAQSALSEIEAGETDFAALERACAECKAAYFSVARELSIARKSAADALDRAVASELAPLKLGKAVFRTDLKADQTRAGPEGFDSVEFLVRTNPGAPEGPLKTIASGGELSRFVLAMKAALAGRENRTVVVFDEVDQGVGGAVADAVGERLARLARDAQVLVVTHSPQVAARAAHHWRVEKIERRGGVRAVVAALAPAERVEEIARMISGAQITPEARAAAARLLGAPAPPRRATRR